MDKRESKHKKSLIAYLKEGGAVIHRNTGAIYCSPRECPDDFNDSPYSYRKCTASDLLADQENESDDDQILEGCS